MEELLATQITDKAYRLNKELLQMYKKTTHKNEKKTKEKNMNYQETYDSTLNLINNQGNANLDYNEILFHA